MFELVLGNHVPLGITVIIEESSSFIHALHACVDALNIIKLLVEGLEGKINFYLQIVHCDKKFFF